VINCLTGLEGWDVVVFTKDWHPPDHISFVTNAYKFEQHIDSVVSFSLNYLDLFEVE